MGPDEGSKQRADTDVCLYFCLRTLEEQLEVHECFFKAAALGLSPFAGSTVITCSLFIRLALPFSFLSCVRAFPEGKIGHEL